MTTIVSTRPPSASFPSIRNRRTNVGTGERVVSTLAGTALGAWGLANVSWGGGLAAAAGAGLIARGLSGFCIVYAATGRDTTRPEGRPALEASTTVTVYRPRKEVYAFWRNLENLPRFMRHLRHVDERGGRSHWVARLPKDIGELDWDAEIIDENKNERITWVSLPGASIKNRGSVWFEDVPGKKDATEVHVSIAYEPPAGKAGRKIAKAIDPAFEQYVKEDLRRFKHILEAGEVPSTEGQPSARA